jgi:beta-amylase
MCIGDAIMSSAAQVYAKYLNATNTFHITGKVSGVHWWYKSAHHAAELTAGYYNTNNNNAYQQLAAMVPMTCLCLDGIH